MVKNNSVLVVNSQNVVNIDITSQWHQVMAEIHLWQKMRDLATTQLVIVLPFVQLIAPARLAWGAITGNGFLPRIETTQTWAARIGSMHIAGLGPRMDSAIDHLQAKEWLKRLQNDNSPELINALVTPLVEMATELTLTAGAMAPQAREKYWEKVDLIARQTPPGIAGIEAALGPLALAWAKATEKWSSDALFTLAQTSHNEKERKTTAIIVVQAGGKDALTQQLYEHWNPSYRLWLNLDESRWFTQKPLISLNTENSIADHFHNFYVQHKYELGQKNLFEDVNLDKVFQEISSSSPPQWQKAQDAEDEAQRAAAKIISLLNAGIMPVALCSQDRPIARRVWALLSRQNIPIADETGWTLSTTRCAALVMGLMKAALPQATTDHVLNAFKTFPEHVSFIRHLDEMERYFRKNQQANWSQQPLVHCSNNVQALWRKINGLLTTLQDDRSQQRSLAEHLHALGMALKRTMAWSVLMADVAGREIIQILHLDEIADVAQEQNQALDEHVLYSSFIQKANTTHMSYLEFTHWVDHVLENMTFIPPAPEQPQVILTPLARVMLRPFAAVVIPGCDDSRLTVPARLSGFWSESDRATLGLMNRALWWERLQTQWIQALRLPNVSLIWRISEGSQPLGPATLVQRVIAPSNSKQHQNQFAETRLLQKYEPMPEFAPAPSLSQCLDSVQLTASAYHVLRECPYKYYAQYLLNLRELAELDGELTRKDYGNWLHAVLRDFHEKRMQARDTEIDSDLVLLDQCANDHAQMLDEASLVPWQARWPTLRDAYLSWLNQYEQDGGHFVCAEFSMKCTLNSQITLQGRVDRLDLKDDIPIFIDYKTERRSKTESRVKNPYEDVQLPFYALLAQGEMLQSDISISNTENARAIYLSLDDRENLAKAVEQTALQEIKVLLAQSMIHDFKRLKNGFPAYPIGQGQTCDYCAVKGLCRKDYWTSPVPESRLPGQIGHKQV